MFPELDNLPQFAVGFTLTFFRVAGLMLMAPLFGSARLPARFKVMIALVMAVPMFLHSPANIPMPDSTGRLVVGLAGELALGLLLGLTVAIVFIAAQWSGEMVGQQIGFNLAETFDPQFGGGGSLVGDLSFMLATAIFLIIDGHVSLVHGILAMPPLTFVADKSLLAVLLDFLSVASNLALRLSAPMFVTMVIVDVAIGCISRTMPQLNVMSAGMAIRAIIGLIVLIVGIGVSSRVLRDGLLERIERFLEMCLRC
jgi:flagellar biosynthesis protein FliR